MQDFNNKVAVITGGASGVGRSLAFALGRLGAKIAVGDVDGSAMEQVHSDLAAEGIECLVQFCDVTSLESLDALADKAQEQFGGIHLVFANAGIGAGESGAMWDYSDKDWQWCLNVNLWGVINSIKAFMPRLVAQNEPAHFVVTGSGNGRRSAGPATPAPATALSWSTRISLFTPPVRLRCMPLPRTFITRSAPRRARSRSVPCSPARMWWIPACSTPAGCDPRS